MQSIVDSVSQAFDTEPFIAHENSLSVLDNRTGKTYSIAIDRNAIRANDLKQIKASSYGSNPVDQVERGLRVLDPGFINTAVVESGITFIDGKRGTIHFREHNLDNLVRNNDWEEVVYMINFGYLPRLEEKMKFRRELAKAAMPPQAVIDVVHAFPRDALIPSMIQAGMSAWASCDEGSRVLHTTGLPYYVRNMPRVDAAIVRTLSALGTSIALSYCHKHGKNFTSPDPNGSFIGNMLLMMGHTKDGKPNAQIERCLEKLWILYADHEMTNSTAGFLHTASTLTDPISAVTSAVICGYGPLHGAAIEVAYYGFKQMGSPEGVPAFIEGVKAGKQRLFGYGHRIYTARDPRANWISAMIEEHRQAVYSNPLLRVAMEVDRVANTDPYFTSRGLKANADLYGCFLYSAMGFETDIIVAMAALSRTGGLMAHWREAMQQKPKIWRPQQVFTGSIRVHEGAKL